MMPDLYWCANGPMPTTAAVASVTTGTAIKTLLQIATPATRILRVVSWGISFDGSSAAVPIKCELIQTDVAATVTAHVAAGVQPFNDPNAPASLVTLGTSATGYTATVEGTITATRYADLQLIAPTNQYVYQWPLDNEFQMPFSKFLRVRVTAAVAVNAYTWVCWAEG
jgi:hypothetical protein